MRSGRSLQILKPLNAITIVEAARAQTSDEPVQTATIATQTVKNNLLDVASVSTKLLQKQSRYDNPLSNRS